MLQRNGVPVSTHDLTAAGFVLLTGAGGGNWMEAANALAAAGIPLKAYRIAPDGDLTNPDGGFERTLGIGAQGALLLRPDGVIGWRTRGPHADPRARLDEVMRRLTFRRRPVTGAAAISRLPLPPGAHQRKIQPHADAFGSELAG
jgi:hypothetical protein